MQNEIHMNDHATHMNTRVTKIQINQCVMSQIPSFLDMNVYVYSMPLLRMCRISLICTCTGMGGKESIFMGVGSTWVWVQHDKET